MSTSVLSSFCVQVHPLLALGAAHEEAGDGFARQEGVGLWNLTGEPPSRGAGPFHGDTHRTARGPAAIARVYNYHGADVKNRTGAGC